MSFNSHFILAPALYELLSISSFGKKLLGWLEDLTKLSLIGYTVSFRLAICYFY